MAIKRYMASADTTITNAYKADLQTVGTGSNMGQSDILEVFYIYNQIDAGSDESARILIKFPVDEILSDRGSEDIPLEGDVSFILKLYNAEHGSTLPTNFSLDVTPMSKDWEEGHGIDMEEYSDAAANGEDPENQFGGTGASWNVAGNESDWDTPGGDFVTPAPYQQDFDSGTEDISIDITDLVEEWLSEDEGEGGDARENYGLMIKFQALNEGGEERSYYTKRFFARGTQFFYKRPMIEAQWDSSQVDNRLNLQTESPFMSEEQNTQVFYYKHSHRGELKDINEDDSILPKFALTSDSSLETKVTIPVDSNEVGDVECTRDKRGVYKASFKVSRDIDADTLYEKWWVGDDEDTLLRGKGGSSTVSVTPWDEVPDPPVSFVTSCTNLKHRYIKGEQARIRIFIRSKDWNPTIYTKATADLSTEVIEWAFYRIVRVVDELIIVNWYDENSATKLSYDENGCYFDLDMDILESGWQYRIELAYRIDEEIKIQPETFKFRIEGE